LFADFPLVPKAGMVDFPQLQQAEFEFGLDFAIFPSKKKPVGLPLIWA